MFGYESFDVPRRNIKAPPSTAGGFSVGLEMSDFTPIIDGLSQAPTKIQKMIRNISEVTGEEVVRVAKKYIGTGGPVVNAGGYSINGWPAITQLTARTRKKNPNANQILLDEGESQKSIKHHVVGGYVTVSATNWKANYHEQGGKSDSGYMSDGKYIGNIPARPFITPAVFQVLYDRNFEKSIIKFIDQNFDFAEFADAKIFKKFYYRAVPKTRSARTVKYKKRKK
jgi:phage gpG-like protein